MENKRIVVALGHAALGTTYNEQKKAVVNAAKAIADLVEEKYQVVITHSNAPQVGMIHTAMTEFSRLDNEYTVAPLSVCSAMSQGYIGYDLQNAIRTELLNRGIFKTVSTLITQVRVDPFDPAFTTPTKIIGRLMTAEEAQAEEEKGNHTVQVEGGYRRIIAAPKPIEIYEIDAIKALLDANQVVIACGGGGIPVVKDGLGYKGVDAVIDKDFASSKLAANIKADILLILTAVDKVYINYNKDNQMALDSTDTLELQKYIDEGHFAKGSMLPKINACMNFLNENSEGTAIIASLNEGLEAINGDKGTRIFYRRK